MSIVDAIREAIGRKRLFLLEPEFGSDRVTRTLLLHPELVEHFDRAHGVPRLGQLKADLEHFVIGGEITMCMIPRRHRTAYMGLLQPPNKGTWDIRSLKPSPGIRVFGAFADRDIFVALHWLPRSIPVEGFDRKPLKDDELEWQFAMMEAEARWKVALPGVSPK